MRRSSPCRRSTRSPSTPARILRGCWPARRVRTGARRCSAPTTSDARGPRRPAAPSASQRAPMPRWSGSGSSGPLRRVSPAWSTPAPSRPRSSVPTTAESTSSSCAACGTTRTVPPGNPVEAARRSTRSSRTPPIPRSSRWRCPPAASTAPRTAEPAGRRTTAASARSSSPARRPSTASACTRWPWTRATRTASTPRTTAGCSAPTMRPDRGRPSPTGFLPTSGSRSSRTHIDPTRSTCSRWSPTSSASHRPASPPSGGPTTRGRRGARRGPACRPRRTRRCCVTRSAATPPTRSACTSAPGTAPCG